MQHQARAMAVTTELLPLWGNAFGLTLTRPEYADMNAEMSAFQGTLPQGAMKRLKHIPYFEEPTRQGVTEESMAQRVERVATARGVDPHNDEIFVALVEMFCTINT